jgi:hypothetical protein
MPRDGWDEANGEWRIANANGGSDASVFVFAAGTHRAGHSGRREAAIYDVQLHIGNLEILNRRMG